ncbi:MAG: NAD(P)H-hydrate dehydratase [Phycisphaerales bacterium]|nr:NAD(P)H-hydrate dehydratase [Phycisphaerales bacterium]
MVRTIPSPPRQATDAHKGDCGRLLVLAGSLGMSGAPALVGLAALRSGAGLVTIAVPRSIQQAVASCCPCATTIGLPETSTGQIDPQAARSLFKDLGLLDPAPVGNPPDCLLTGPGIGRGPGRYGRDFWELINAFRNGPLVPAVIDADALNLIEKTGADRPDGWDGQFHFRTVITPHPGELARMHGVSIREIQADRRGYAVRTANLMKASHDTPEYAPTVVLKGAGTVVTDGRRVYTNRTGNPGMATGGSGDVLTGIIGALIGQGMDSFEAAVTGVYVHGLAGDMVAGKIGQISLIATDLIDALPQAFMKMTRSRKKTTARRSASG